MTIHLFIRALVLLAPTLSIAAEKIVTLETHTAKSVACTLTHEIAVSKSYIYLCGTKENPILLAGNDQGQWSSVGLPAGRDAPEFIPIAKVSAPGGRTLAVFNSALHTPTHDGQLIELAQISEIQKFIDHPSLGTGPQEYNDARSLLRRSARKKAEKIERALQAADDIAVKLTDGRELTCKRTATPSRSKTATELPRSSCELFVCKPQILVDGKSFEALLFHNSTTGVFKVPPHLTLSNSEGLGPDIRIEQTRSKNSTPASPPFFRTLNPKTNPFSTSRAPAELQGLEATLNLHANPGFHRFRESLRQSCNDPELSRLLAQEVAGYEKAKPILAQTETEQLISWIDGRLLSELIPKSTLPPNACLKDGAYLTPEAMRHFEGLRRFQSSAQATALTPEELEATFQKILNMKDIPFEYAQDGCYARAQVISSRLADEGILTEKIWIAGNVGPEKKPDITWVYHVAPVVHVRLEDGKIERRVLDPSVANAPLTPEEWAKLSDRNSSASPELVVSPLPRNSGFYQRAAITYTPWTQYYPWTTDTTPDPKANLKHAQEELAMYSRVLDAQKRRSALAKP
jgi:hypothetical protein